MIDWLMTHGSRVLVIIIVAIASYFLLRHFVPLLVKRAVARQTKRRPEGEIKKQANTLSSVSVQIGVVVFAILTILPEFGVNIAAELAGFGAQSLIKDLIAGIFILLENQYRVDDVPMFDILRDITALI
jgi:small conductance mechanosensitive channel